MTLSYNIPWLGVLFLGFSCLVILYLLYKNLLEIKKSVIQREDQLLHMAVELGKATKAIKVFERVTLEAIQRLNDRLLAIDAAQLAGLTEKQRKFIHLPLSEGSSNDAARKLDKVELTAELKKQYHKEMSDAWSSNT